MIDFDVVKDIYVYSKGIDMRMGMNRIKNILSITFSPVEIIDSVFIFVSRDRKAIKIYYEDIKGSWLLINKVQYYRFQVENIREGEVITKNDLKYLLQGVEILSKREKKISI